MPIWLLLLFLPLVAQLALLYALAGALNGMTFRRFGKTIYLLFMWPGVVVHELSHLVGCVITGTKVTEVKLFAPHVEGGSFVLGYVGHHKPKNAFAQVIISSAPFFGGAAALWGMLRLMAPRVLASGIFGPKSFGAITAAGVIPAAKAVAVQYWAFGSTLLASLDWSSWKTYLFLYLLFSVSAHIAPSAHDMKFGIAGAVAVAVSLFLFTWIGSRYAPAATAAFASGAGKAVGGLTALMSYGVACVTLVFLAVWSAFFVIDALRRR